MHSDYNRTIRACFVSSFIQAIVINFMPLLFVTFHTTYGISLAKITLLTTINFFLQLCVDAVSVVVVDRVGYRRCAVAAQLFSAAGIAASGTAVRLRTACCLQRNSQTGTVY